MTTIGEYFERVRIRGINEGIGRDDIVQSFHGTPNDGEFELPVGPQGPDGPQGPAAHRFKHEGDIADSTALNALATELGPAQAGTAWRVLSTNRLMVWNGAAFDTFTEAFGGHGPVGEANTLSVDTVTTTAAGTDASVTITGTSPEQTIDVTVPRGVKGAKGPIGSPGPLRDSTDYDNTVTHVDRMVPLWNADTEKWTPTVFPGWRGPWTVVEDQSWDGLTGFVASTSWASVPQTVATINIPAQDVRWRPFVTGGGLFRTAATGGVHLDAFLGSTSGPDIGHGTGMPDNAWCFTNLIPYGTTAGYTPDSTVGTVEPGSATTIYLRVTVPSATTFFFDRAKAHLAVWAIPVTGAPE